MNIQVKTPIILEPLGNRQYRVRQPIEFIIKFDKFGTYHFKIQEGFITDFRSGGPIVDLFFDQMGENENIRIAYLMHDLMYTPCGIDREHICSKEFADDRLFDVLVHAGMPRLKAALVRWAVRTFGKKAYNTDLYKENYYRWSYEWETAYD